MTTTHAGVTANFPFPTLTPFATEHQPPTHTTLLLLQRELNSNAMSVHSNDGGGLHGHLVLTVTPQRYAIIAGVNNPFPVPIAPPPLINPAGTQIQVAEAIRQHAEQGRTFTRYHDTDKALVRAIIAATPSTYIDALADAELGYANITTLALLHHLQATYGTMTAADRDANLARMVLPWSPPQPIEALFKQLDDGQRLATLANEPIADTQLARMGQTLILKTGLFPDGCREWRLMPDAQQTWPNFKRHFTRMERDRLETATTSTAGYTNHAYAAAQIPLPHNQSPPTLTVPTPASINAVAQVPTTADLALLMAELTRLRAAAARMPAASTNVSRGYCWTHGSTTSAAHTSATCKNRADGHNEAATWRNKLGGNPDSYVPPSRRGRGQTK
jgi:hypothetical protein